MHALKYTCTCKRQYACTNATTCIFVSSERCVDTVWCSYAQGMPRLHVSSQRARLFASFFFFFVTTTLNNPPPAFRHCKSIVRAPPHFHFADNYSSYSMSYASMTTTFLNTAPTAEFFSPTP